MNERVPVTWLSRNSEMMEVPALCEDESCNTSFLPPAVKGNGGAACVWNTTGGYCVKEGELLGREDGATLRKTVRAGRVGGLEGNRPLGHCALLFGIALAFGALESGSRWFVNTS